MARISDGLAQILLPKGKAQAGGRGFTPTYNPRQSVMTAPQYREHLTDLFSTRLSSDSRTLIATLANADPDISAAINAFLSVSGSVDPVIYAYDNDDNIDPVGIAAAQKIWALLTTTNDYSIGYSAKPTQDALISDMKYMILLRGMVATELVLDKRYVPVELRQVDPATLEWNQKQNGVYAPVQKAASSNQKIDLNIPTFFTSTFNQSPLDMYTYSPFVSAINTIASRTQVIQELYRIMKIVGYPRIDIEVLDDVLMESAPPNLRGDPEKLRAFVNAELRQIQAAIANLESDQAFVHSKAVSAKVLNDKNPGAGIQISAVIDVLNAQNQAALKVMPAVVGKANNGQVASTEARLFALSADALNRAVAGVLSKALTFATRVAGYGGRVEVIFPKVELRPELELEPQKTMKASRLATDLSRGMITDEEYTMEMYGRPPLPGAPKLSGTGFMDPQKVSVDETSVSANTDSLGRGLSGDNPNAGKDNNATAGGGGKNL